MAKIKGSVFYLHAIHQVTGELCVRGFSPTLSPELLEKWAAELEGTARDMRDHAESMRPAKKGRKR